MPDESPADAKIELDAGLTPSDALVAPKDVAVAANSASPSAPVVAVTERQFIDHPHFRLAASTAVFLGGIIVIMLSAWFRGPGELSHFAQTALTELGLTFCITAVTYFIFQQIVDQANNKHVRRIVNKAVTGMSTEIGGAVSQVSTKIEYINSSLDKVFKQNDILNGAFESAIVCIHQNRGEAAEDILDAMQTSKTIRVMGVSLRDYFTPGGKHHAQIDRLLKDIVDSKVREFRTLLLNPYSDQAKIRAERESLGDFAEKDAYIKSGLYSEVKQSIQYLLRKCNSPRVIGKLYKSAPTCFLVITDDFTYLEQYHYGLAESGLKGGNVPVLKFSSNSDVANQLTGHFDYVWIHHSIAFHETEVAMMVGVPKNAEECQLVNLFPTRADAVRRIEYLFQYEATQAIAAQANAASSNAGASETTPQDGAHRVVRLIGISLRDFFNKGPFYTSMKTRFGSKPILVQALLLDPHSEQGKLRSEREDPGLPPSSLYTDVRSSLKYIVRLNSTGTEVQARLYRGAPSCFVVLTEDSAIVEQYHYGSEDPGDTILGGRVPVLEFHKDSSMYSALFEHFRYMWNSEKMSQSAKEWWDQHEQGAVVDDSEDDES